MGQCPGETEDWEGEAFVGASGRFLRDTASDIFRNLTKIGFLNVIKCHPPENREPTMQEYTSCKRFFYENLRELNPKIIIPLGNWALKALIGKVGITTYRGEVFNTPHGKVIPTFHPAAILRSPWKTDEFVADLNRAMEFLREVPCLSSNFKLVNSTDELRMIINFLSSIPIIGFDIETSSKKVLENSKILTLGISWMDNQGICIPMQHNESPLNLSIEEWKDILLPIFSSSTIRKVAHNIKFEMKFLWGLLGIKIVPPYDDTMLIHYTTDERRGTHGLKKLVWQYFPQLGGYETEIEAMSDTIAKSRGPLSLEDGYGDIPLSILWPYNCRDAEVTLRLWRVFQENSEFIAQRYIYDNFDLPRTWPLAKMEVTGACCDKRKLVLEAQRIPVELQRIEVEIKNNSIIRRAEEILNTPEEGKKPLKVWKQFNVKSVLHKRLLLYQILEIPETKLTKKGDDPSTDKTIFEKYKDQYPIIGLLSEQGKLRDRESKLITPLVIQTQITDRITTNYNQHGTVTARLSSSTPNLQNVDAELKGLFKSNLGILLEADFEQLELRLGSLLSEDETMIQGFYSGKDFHRFAYSMMCNKPEEEVTDSERGIAKKINFGIWYCQSPYGLAETLKCTVREAASHLERYLQVFPMVENYQKEIKWLVSRQGYATTSIGRKRRLPEVNSPDERTREEALRQAVNFTIQSLGSEMTLESLRLIDEWLEENKFTTKLVLTVHDSLVLDGPLTEMGKVVKKVRDVMEVEVPRKFGLPTDFFKVGIKIGSNWKDMTPLT